MDRLERLWKRGYVKQVRFQSICQVEKLSYKRIAERQIMYQLLDIVIGTKSQQF